MLELFVEELRRNLDYLFVHLFPKYDAQRNDGDTKLLCFVRGQVSRAISDDSNGQGRGSFPCRPVYQRRGKGEQLLQRGDVQVVRLTSVDDLNPVASELGSQPLRQRLGLRLRRLRA